MKRIALALAALLPAAALAAWSADETPGAATFRVEAAVDGRPVDFTAYAGGGMVRGGRPVRVVLVDHAGRPEAGHRGRRIVLLHRQERFVPGSAPYPLHPR